MIFKENWRNRVMDRNQAKELLPIIKAFSEGKTIEMKCAESWIEIEDICDFHSSSTFRIKPEPKYRPFKDAEECWQEMLKHQPFGWLKDKVDGHFVQLTVVDSKGAMSLNRNQGWTLWDMMQCYTFADGAAFGILEEE